MKVLNFDVFSDEEMYENPYNSMRMTHIQWTLSCQSTSAVHKRLKTKTTLLVTVRHRVVEVTWQRRLRASLVQASYSLPCKNAHYGSAVLAQFLSS